jgi:hypothetical protein
LDETAVVIAAGWIDIDDEQAMFAGVDVVAHLATPNCHGFLATLERAVALLGSGSDKPE